MSKERIDKLLTDRGLADSRTKAQALIMAGVVLVGERRVEKPSESYSPDASIRIKGDTPEARYVSRGGLKLEAALTEFSITPARTRCLDIGSSTGGFTDCLLRHGAASVTCIDAGTNQLDWRLRTDPRVTVLDRTNVRLLQPDVLPYRPDVVVADLSFISLSRVLDPLVGAALPGGHLVLLVKPQFEAGKVEVAKAHGVITDPAIHERVTVEVHAALEERGCTVLGWRSEEHTSELQSH